MALNECSLGGTMNSYMRTQLSELVEGRLEHAGQVLGRSAAALGHAGVAPALAAEAAHDLAGGLDPPNPGHAPTGLPVVALAALVDAHPARPLPPLAIEAEVAARDQRDSQREESPLTLDGSYTRIDTGSLSAAEELLSALLDISKFDSGMYQPQPEALAVADLFEQLRRRFKPLAVNRGLELRVRPAECFAHSDRNLLYRILQNFLANALRYTESGGVLLGCRRRGETLVLSVWDTGVGIDLGVVFRPLAAFDGAAADVDPPSVREGDRERGEQPDQHCAIETGRGPGARCDTECEGHGKGDNGRSHAAKKITSQIVEPNLVEDTHGQLTVLQTVRYL